MELLSYLLLVVTIQNKQVTIAGVVTIDTLINVDAPGCGTSVVRGPTGHKKEGFHPGVQLYQKVSSPKMLTSYM